MVEKGVDGLVMQVLWILTLNLGTYFQLSPLCFQYYIVPAK